MMIAAYRMVIQDWPRAKAIEEMERMGFNSWIIPIKQYLLNVDIGELRRELAEGRRLAAHLEQPTPLADRR